jgi:hypothetical protein
MGAWIHRSLEGLLKQEASRRPVVLLTGPRQVGKSLLLERTFPRAARVSLDLPSVAEEADQSGASFLARHPTPLIIDEVQYAPRLFRALKAAVDARRNVPGQYLLTGSQRFPLMAGVSESLAGRVAVLSLHTLSLEESGPASGDALLSRIWTGGYPELVAKKLSPRRFYEDYVATHLERDIRQVLMVRNLRDFDRFLRLCALRTGQLLSLGNLASDVGISPNTVKAWLGVLEASDLVRLVPPWSRNLGRRLVKTPKLYFLDTGLAAFLAGVDRPETLRAGALLGPFFETFVFGQLVRRYAARGEADRICFYRDHQGVEVDFVREEAGKLRLIEVKWAETPDPSPPAFAALEQLLGKAQIRSKAIITPHAGRRRTSSGTVIAGPGDLDFLEG